MAMFNHYSTKNSVNLLYGIYLFSLVFCGMKKKYWNILWERRKIKGKTSRNKIDKKKNDERENDDRNERHKEWLGYLENTMKDGIIKEKHDRQIV